MNNSNIQIISEKVQIILWLIRECDVFSTIKLSILSSILFKAKNSMTFLSKIKNDYFAKLIKFSNISLEELSIDIKNEFICMDLLCKKNIIAINKCGVTINELPEIIELDYLTYKVKDGLKQIVCLTDDSFIDEVLKYV